MKTSVTRVEGQAAFPQVKQLKMEAPGILQSLAASPWHPAWQPAASKFMPTTPGVDQDKQ
eukprot:1161433-Pelagomonas_calceolata.AAC.3